MGAAARFNQPWGVACDGTGNLYVADDNDDTIRKITPGGVVTTLAGTFDGGGAGAVNGPGSVATFSSPTGMAADSNGNVFVCDGGLSWSIREINPDSYVTTVNGSNQLVGRPTGVAVDSHDDLFVSDGQVIQEITPGGTVTTLAGTANTTGNSNGAGNVALFHGPNGVAVDGSGNVYVADSGNNEVRKISGGVVSTIGPSSQFNNPQYVCVDGSGNVYVTDCGNNRIREISSGGTITTLAGSSVGQAGSTDGSGTAARFDQPEGITINGSGNLYVADTTNNTIRQITTGAAVTTFAGTAAFSNMEADGTGAAARLDNPTGVAVAASGNLYVTDELGQAVRKITPGGVVTTFASGSSFFYPGSVAVDANENIYVHNWGDSNVLKIASSGQITTIASSFYLGAEGGIAVNPTGSTIYVEGGNVIYQINSTGVVTPYAGASSGSADGTGTLASFNNPQGLALDSNGNLYVADTGNDLIRKIAPGAVVTTVGGTTGVAGSNDGTGPGDNLFASPEGIAVDGHGNLYISDTGNETIRTIAPGGASATLAGTVGDSGSANGSGPDALFAGPLGIAVNTAGQLYVADSNNDQIRLGLTSSLANSLYFQNGVNLGALGLNPDFAPVAWRGIGAMNTGWREAAVADVNGDGAPDLIFQNGAQIGVVLMNANGLPSSWAAVGNLASGWTVCAAAQITKDGNVDLLCQNGTLLAYLEINNSAQPIFWIGIGVMGSGWQLRAAADLTGSGEPSLLFQNGTSIGSLQVDFNGVPTTWTGIGALNSGWILSDAVDANSDGQPDLIFQNGDSLGALEINASLQPVAWYGIGVLGSGWALPGN
jgi:sugar lactone lactonase YvrE